MKGFLGNLFGKKQTPPEIPKRNEPVRQNQSQHEADEFYKKGDLIGGEFEVVGNLGKGGFGLVYRARHCETGAEFALKTFRDEFLDDSKARDAFKKEALLWVNLENHPFILAATVVLEISGRLFVAMEYIAPDKQGRVNLADHLAQTAGRFEPIGAVVFKRFQFASQFRLAVDEGMFLGNIFRFADLLV